MAHQIAFWGLIYYSQKHIKRYSSSLHLVNIAALAMNAFFIAALATFAAGKPQ